MRLTSTVSVCLWSASELSNCDGNKPVESGIHKSVRVRLPRAPTLRRLYNRAESRAPPGIPKTFQFGDW